MYLYDWNERRTQSGKSSSRLFFFRLLLDSLSGLGGLTFIEIFSAVLTSLFRSFSVVIQSIWSMDPCLSTSFSQFLRAVTRDLMPLRRFSGQAVLSLLRSARSFL